MKFYYLLIHLLQGYSRKECSQHLSIYLYLTSMKKTLDDCTTDCTISQDNANTAFTFACKRNNEVYLYRKEEWFKVLCHELFHSFGLDFSEFECSEVDKKMFTVFPIKTDLRLYEAYTELWGEMLNAMFIAHFSVNSEEYDYFIEEGSEYQQAYLNKMLKKVEPLLYQERMFSVFQASKILTHYGMSYDDLYSKDTDAIKARNGYKESTPVLSYYIIKNILLQNRLNKRIDNIEIEQINIKNSMISMIRSSKDTQTRLNAFDKRLERNEITTKKNE